MAINKKFFLWFIFLFIFLFSQFEFISTGVSDAGVEYDSDLLNAFENSNYVSSLLTNPSFIGLETIDNKLFARVSVVLKDNSGIIIEGTKEERRELVNQKMDWIEKETEKIE